MKLLGDALRLNVPVTGKAFALLALSCTFLMFGQVEAAPQKAASGKAAAKSAPERDRSRRLALLRAVPPRLRSGPIAAGSGQR